ncbi:hypothetical protein GGD63_001099 [Bradyrhizobium sp. cir1]|uniref:hypothetical protein n=1 Tax=Bradyrhizobium sp. cir1 TaxID=1445730 RepID=UPI0016064A76|nr:hypothetical protein [Bradyrhizobium sp. cir1]MBB4368320.1 hypothetical protein [Bradyrhizobium sp. cir1]
MADSLVRDVARYIDGTRAEPFFAWIRQSDGSLTLELGLDSAFSVQLGLAGALGMTQDRFLVSLRGDGCRTKVAETEIALGQSVRFEIEMECDSGGAVEAIFFGRDHRSLRLRLEVPGDGAEESFQGRADS